VAFLFSYCRLPKFAAALQGMLPHKTQISKKVKYGYHQVEKRAV
jgi:hypothetical protein